LGSKPDLDTQLSALPSCKRQKLSAKCCELKSTGIIAILYSIRKKKLWIGVESKNSDPAAFGNPYHCSGAAI